MNTRIYALLMGLVIICHFEPAMAARSTAVSKHAHKHIHRRHVSLKKRKAIARVKKEKAADRYALLNE